MGTTYVDAYHEFCWTRELHRIHLPKPSTQRRVRRTARWVSTAMLSVVTFVGIAIVAGPRLRRRLPNPVLPACPPSCRQGSSAIRTPSTQRCVHQDHRSPRRRRRSRRSRGWRSPRATRSRRSTSRQVRSLARRSRSGRAPRASATGDPRRVRRWTRGRGHQLSQQLGDGHRCGDLERAVTISVPSSSTPTAVATSPSTGFALVVDVGTGKVSIINLQTTPTKASSRSAARPTRSAPSRSRRPAPTPTSPIPPSTTST